MVTCKNCEFFKNKCTCKTYCSNQVIINKVYNQALDDLKREIDNLYMLNGLQKTAIQVKHRELKC